MEPASINLVDVLEFVGDIAFALSGAFAVAARRFDIMVVCFAAVATGLVGGTLRDVLIGAPVSWLVWPLLLAACLVAAGVVWAAGETSWGDRAVLWFDAVGLAGVLGAGVAHAADRGVTPLAAAVVGVLAAAAGGLVRDGLAGRKLLMLERQLYLAAAAAGAALFVALRLAGADAGVAALAAALLTLALRSGALRLGWRFPERD